MLLAPHHPRLPRTEDLGPDPEAPHAAIAPPAAIVVAIVVAAPERPVTAAA